MVISGVIPSLFLLWIFIGIYSGAISLGRIFAGRFFQAFFRWLELYVPLASLHRDNGDVVSREAS